VQERGLAKRPDMNIDVALNVVCLSH
jgi:hypothetical protein